MSAFDSDPSLVAGLVTWVRALQAAFRFVVPTVAPVELQVEQDGPTRDTSLGFHCGPQGRASERGLSTTSSKQAGACAPGGGASSRATASGMPRCGILS